MSDHLRRELNRRRRDKVRRVTAPAPRSPSSRSRSPPGWSLAPAALAADGVGLYGRTDDKVVTYFAFAVMVFFTVIVIAFSLVQGRLDSRKERAREELERLRRP